MPSLKPRTAPPRSAPMLRSFLVPKISITITRTISQCQMLNEPITFSLLLLVAPHEHGAERIRPAEDVHVDMIHLLMPHPPRVDDGAETVVGAGFPGQFACQRKHFPQRLVLLHGRVVQGGNVLLRDDQEVDRRGRPDVVERQHVLVLVHLLRRDLAAHDLAEDAVCVAGHFLSAFLAAFSSSPEMPSRRCISASTSPGPRPWRASTIIEWNQRSATSRTRCSRSPLFAASTVSVASSPIFFTIASSPLANSLAT